VGWAHSACVETWQRGRSCAEATAGVVLTHSPCVFLRFKPLWRLLAVLRQLALMLVYTSWGPVEVLGLLHHMGP
jgi:hypothetical protein